MPTFTVLVIATNRYINFLPSLLTSIDQNLFLDSTGQVMVFTNHNEISVNEISDRVSVQKVLIPNLGWPDATLKRYAIFTEHWGKISGDYVIYIDVDAVVVGKPLLRVIVDDLNSHNSDIFVVRHPGYFRRDWKTWIAARRKSGIWETRRESMAFVPLFSRRTYVAGGVWGGKRSALYRMISQLKINVEIDLQKEIVAIFHDESHLNNWVTKHHVLKLSPAWVFAPGYENLLGIEPIIEVIHKPEEFFEARID